VQSNQLSVQSDHPGSSSGGGARGVQSNQIGGGTGDGLQLALPGCAIQERTVSADYYIPACAEGTPPAQCIHVIQVSQPLCLASHDDSSLLRRMHNPVYSVPETVKIVQALPHVHTRARRGPAPLRAHTPTFTHARMHAM
jgi:hypothetical protein